MATSRSAADAQLDQPLRERGNLALQYLLADFDNLVKQRLGFMPWEYVVQRVNGAAGPFTLLSLSCGQAALELYLASQFGVSYRFDCLDADAGALQEVLRQARRQHLSLKTLQQDLETLTLPPNEYDLIIAHACLHPVRNLEGVYAQVAQALKPDGRLLVNDITPRNGWRLWPETAAFLDHLWSVLPDRCKIDRASLAMMNGVTPWLGRLIDGDYGVYGSACARSEEVLPLLRASFDIDLEVPGYAFARRLLGKEFGPNYAMHDPTDRAIVEFILRLDKECVAGDKLRPENVFVLASRKRAVTHSGRRDASPERVSAAARTPAESVPELAGELETSTPRYEDEQVKVLLEQLQRQREDFEAVLRSRDEFILSQKAAYEQLMQQHDLVFAAKVGRFLPLHQRLVASWPYRLAARLGLVRAAKALLRRFIS